MSELCGFQGTADSQSKITSRENVSRVCLERLRRSRNAGLYLQPVTHCAAIRLNSPLANLGDRMAIRSWLQKMVGGQGAAQSDKATSASDAPMARPNTDDAIAYAVSLSGLVNEQPGTLAIYRATFADHPSRFVTYVDLRKRGDLLDKKSLKALGLRSNVKLSAQFLATLNDRGRADPLGAASVIGLAISTALCTLRDLANMQAAGIDLTKFQGSSMAAGPCAAAAKLDDQRIAVADAPMLPLETCPHPDQCACRYQAWLSMLED